MITIRLRKQPSIQERYPPLLSAAPSLRYLGDATTHLEILPATEGANGASGDGRGIGDRGEAEDEVG